MIYKNSTMKCPETIFMTLLSLPHLSSLVFFFFFGLHTGACRNLVPWPGIAPGPSGVEAKSLHH